MSEKTKATNEEKRQIAAELNEMNAATTQPEPDTPPQEPPKKRGRKKAAETQPAPQAAEVIEEAHPDNTAGNKGIVLLCDHCGAELYPDREGMYPANCPNCNAENDYRGIGFLERSEDILVCDRCGHLTKIKPNTTCCSWCGAGE